MTVDSESVKGLEVPLKILRVPEPVRPASATFCAFAAGTGELFLNRGKHARLH